MRIWRKCYGIVITFHTSIQWQLQSSGLLSINKWSLNKFVKWHIDVVARKESIWLLGSANIQEKYVNTLWPWPTIIGMVFMRLLL